MGSVITAITGVFSSIADWFVTFIPTLIELFYTEASGLTLLGTLSICSLAISVFFLILGLIQNFLHFKA